ncbi:MAG: DUF2452 domain-containing protein [Micrococcales bacterium]|nr:DUF2452 domain-containing protein [Micrococcales bacterium]
MATNSAKGRNSFDANIGGQLIHFVNRNVTEYPTEAGGPNFDLVPVTQQKDIMLNAARMHAKQEYDRIMEIVKVLQKQAEDIKKRLDLTDQVHAAAYQMQLYPGQKYWLFRDLRKGGTALTLTGPNDWNTGIPENYEYLTQIQWLGDYTWMEVPGMKIRD